MPASNWLPGNTDVLTEAQNKTEGNKHHVGLISNTKGESRERKKKRLSWQPARGFGSIHHSGNYLPSVCFSSKK